MPTYEIRAPNGKTYRIDGPAGASDDQVRAQVLRQFPEASGPSQRHTVGDLDPAAAANALSRGRDDLQRQIAGAPANVQADAIKRFYANPNIIKLREMATTKPKSFWQGVLDETGKAASNAIWAMDQVQGRGLTKAITGQPMPSDIARAQLHQQQAASPVRGSTTGHIVGGVIGSLPALALGGPVAQGAASGALLTDDPNDTAGLALDTAIGAGAGKLGDLAFQGASRIYGAGRAVAGDSIAAVAQRLGIRPTPATTGGTLSQIAQTGIGATPGGYGAIAGGVERETGGLASAARGVANQLGPVTTPQGAGQALARGAAAYRRATSALGRRIYGARDELMGGENAPVLLGNTVREIQNFAQQFPNTPLLADIMDHPVVRRLAQALPDGAEPQVTVSEATDALSHIRSAVRNAQKRNVVTTAVGNRVQSVERAIEGDVMNAAQASDAIAGRTGDETATAMQQAGDRLWQQRSATLNGPLKDAYSSFRDPAATSGETVFRRMSGLMQREGGNITGLRKAWAALPSGARRTFSATAFDSLGRAKSGVQNELGSEWSFNTFLTNYDKLAPEARSLVFGGKGVDQQISDIARYAGQLRRTDKLRNYSNTARTYIAGAYLSLLGAQLWQGDVSGTLETAAAYPAMALSGRVFMATPAMRIWTRDVMRQLVQSGTSPGAERALRRLTNQLPVIAARNSAMRDEIMQVFHAVNDNIPAAAAAGNRPEDNQQQ